MKVLRQLAAVLATLLFLTCAQPSEAYRYTPPGPTGSVGLARPTIGQQLLLDPGESISKAEMWLDGRPVPVQVDPGGLVSYTPDAPLSPGTHTVKLSIQVETGEPGYYYPLRTTQFSFQVVDGAIAVLPDPDPESLRALAWVNKYRAAAGLAPMTYDQSLGLAAAGHARYLAENHLQGHYQQPGTPLYFGYAPADRVSYYGYVGGVSEVVHFVDRAEEAVDGWMETIYHRIPLIHPGNRVMGYGHAGRESRANVIEAGPGDDADQTVLWPHPGQTGVPVQWSGLEEPDPLRLYPGTEGPVGYTVTLTFGRAPTHLTLRTAAMTGPGGAGVSVMRFSPENDEHLRDTVALIPYKPLQPGSTYSVRLAGTVDYGEGPVAYDRQWSFTTAPETAVDFGAASWSGSGGRYTVTVEGTFPPGTRLFLGGLPVTALEQQGQSQVRFQLPVGYTGTGSTDLVAVAPGGEEEAWAGFGSKFKPVAGAPAFTPTAASLKLGGREVNVSALRHQDGTLMLPDSVLAQAGFARYDVPEIGRTYWTAGSRTGDVTLGRTSAQVGTERLSLPLPVQLVEGQVYMPAVFVEQLAGLKALDPDRGLTDIAGHWAQPYIVRLVDAGIVAGTGDGSFKPAGGLTRAAFVKMLTAARGLALQPGSTGGFADTRGHWSATQGYLGAAASAGIIRLEDYPGGRFEPDRTITRSEIAVMVVRAMELEARAAATWVSIVQGQAVIAGRTFLDASLWPAPGHVAVAVEEGIVTGIPESGGLYSYRPANQASRAEAAVMVARFLDHR